MASLGGGFLISCYVAAENSNGLLDRGRFIGFVQ